MTYLMTKYITDHMTEDITAPIAIPVITTKIAMSGQFCSFVLLVLRCFYL